MELLKQLFSSGDFRPHGYCYLWNTNLVWLHVVSDSLIALSYFAIPAVLLWIVKRRRDLPFHWMFVLFGIFIVACGATHAIEVWNLWHADYWLAGMVKAVTAAASVSTAILLMHMAPKALALPSVSQLATANSDLEVQINTLREDEMRLMVREAALRDQADLIDLTHDAIFVRDMQSRITFWNRGAEYLYDMPRENVLGRVSHELLHTEFPKPIAEIENDVLTKGYWEGDLIHHRADGTAATVSSRWALQRDEKGQPAGILESNRDITSSRRLEKRFEKLVEGAPDAMVIVNEKGRIELINAQTEKLFGYGRAELIGQPVEILVPPNTSSSAGSGEAYGPPVPREAGAALELNGIRKDGTQFPVEVSLSPLETDQGMLISSAIRDISRRRESIEKIEQLNAALQLKITELDTLNQELESFSYSVSHDLRAPLRHIDGFARFLQEEHAAEISAGASHYLARIIEGANRMGKLIDDLLSLGHVGRREMTARVVKLDDLVKQAMADLPPGTEGRLIEWRIEPLGEALCDAGLVKLIFSNLLANAVKFTRTRENAVIEVGSHDANGTRTYFVRDNGVGFDPKYADKLFGVFQRLHHQRDFEGTGVGLATVRRIARRHGGEAWAESQLDQGATFFFTLAADPKKTAPRAKTYGGAADAGNRGGNLTGGRQ